MPLHSQIRPICTGGLLISCTVTSQSARFTMTPPSSTLSAAVTQQLPWVWPPPFSKQRATSQRQRPFHQTFCNHCNLRRICTTAKNTRQTNFNKSSTSSAACVIKYYISHTYNASPTTRIIRRGDCALIRQSGEVYLLLFYWFIAKKNTNSHTRSPQTQHQHGCSSPTWTTWTTQPTYQ